MLHNLYEYSINGYSAFILDLLFILAVLCAIFVIITKNPIISVLFLIGLFISIASYLISIGIVFIGLSYLLIYVGAVSILFLFILMLINIRISELINDTNNSIPLVIIITLTLSNIIYNLLPNNIDFINKIFILFFSEIFNSPNKNEILLCSSNDWDSNVIEYNNISSIGNIIYTDFFIWLIETSLILLLAMVGAIVITIKPTT